MNLGKPMPPVADYYVLVSRAREWPQAGVWPISVREPLPTIPVPLGADEPHVELPLQALVNRVYETGRYASWIYAEPIAPPLAEAEAAWADAIHPAQCRNHSPRAHQHVSSYARQSVGAATFSGDSARPSRSDFPFISLPPAELSNPPKFYADTERQRFASRRLIGYVLRPAEAASVELPAI